MIENYDNGGYGFAESNAYSTETKPNNLSGVAKIKVIGVGGAGNNAVDRLIESGLMSAEYVVVNTDNQALARSKAANRIQIGVQLTKGLGAGADPSIGRLAAEENKEQIQEALKDTDLVFITAGMGGGTGTGAAPIIAKIAKEMKILTVAVVTLPFTFEAKRRMDNAVMGIEELKKSVDSIITIPNDKIRQVVPKNTSFSDALKVADEVLRQGIRGIAELIVKPSLINLDFADVKTTLKGRGLAHMGLLHRVLIVEHIHLNSGCGLIDSPAAARGLPEDVKVIGDVEEHKGRKRIQIQAGLHKSRIGNQNTDAFVQLFFHPFLPFRSWNSRL